MRKGIDSLAEIIRTEMLHDPYLMNGVYVFMSRDLKKIKVLSRGLRRFELILIRLDEEKFFRPIFGTPGFFRGCPPQTRMTA